MLAHLAVALAQATRQTQQPDAATILQAIWLALAIIFVFSVFTAGFTAKRIENLHDPTYAKAFLATLLKNLLGLAGFFIFGLFLQAPPAVALGLAFGLIPIFIYKLVFSASMWREAALIWFVVTVVETGLGYILMLVGLVSWGIVTGGAT